jgi:pimeloyl-ACP methyl ester carboxylesterase
VRYCAAFVLAAFSVLSCPEAYSADTTGTHSYYEVNGARLYTEKFGHGPPIVFLHGGGNFFDNSFALQRDYFARDHTVIGIDRRGQGHSADGPWALSYQMMADDTAAIIERLGLGAVDIVGHSDGADVALLLARDHPQLVRRIVISGANLRSHLSAEEQQRARWSPEQFAEHVRALADVMPPWFRTDYAKVSPDGPDHWMTLLAKLYEMWLQPVVIEPAALKSFSMPVLVMAGDHDYTSIEEAAEMYRALPKGQLIIVPATGHGMFGDRAGLVNFAIREFLDQPDKDKRTH